ncbi:cysteine desulfurase/selenocysteine lyase [Arthrobacter pascens]|uniref:SufS family cysteine desulfurase n=1 Tax=Arthrobacter pascens TaxID=1677 RepID=UPI002858DA88|nr:SufS family cysteine desulfurase [Arthrobacter pascens]MDR6557088.1 cysteine desulfurase/selenocysteine lyase [Arthrobacter pascens]
MAVVTTPTTLERALPAMDNAEVLRIRNDFPVLDQLVNGRPLVYLDSGATSQNPLSVIEAEQEFYEQRNAAVHRGAHHLAVEATEVFEDARQTVADFVGADYAEIVWTSNATEGLNLISYALSNAGLWAAQGRGDARLRELGLGPGDEIVVTEMEHHANLIPWQELAYRTGAVLRYIPVDDSGKLHLDQAAEIVGERTRLLAFTHASNVLGTINPVAELVAIARRAGALVVLDACQSAPHLSLDVKQLDVDFAVFSGHKMLGPTGIGVLYGKQELLDVLPPYQTGGSMITTVTMERAEYLAAPQRFEAGTQKISQAVALAAAVNYLTETGLDRVHRWESELGQRMVAGLEAIDGIRVLGPAAGQDRIGLAAFDVAGVHAHDVGQFLDARGIAVRVGHHCAQPLHRRLGLTATTRASAYLYNTTDDVDEFLDAVSGVRAYFRA